VIVAEVPEVTAFVLMVKVMDVPPAGTVTVFGAVADERLLDSDMTRPPAGAAELIFTVPTLDRPPFRDVGFSDNEVSSGGVIVS
jgi:hypothetical protein